jgi:NAD(P)-dependent dehydrogenase (short-subunit alcohol dehydrogenase family)
MEIRMDNKLAVITGGASGIGLKTAEMLVASGAKVALVDKLPQRLAEAAKTLENKGTVESYELDITHTADIAPTVTRIREDMGEVDILICCAGTNSGLPCATEDITEEIWDNILSVNTKGLFFCNQAVARQSMIPRRSGAIVNIASDVGIIGAPRALPYIASKAGVVQITKGEAIEWGAYNIRVNAVAPCWVMTGMKDSFFARLPNAAEFDAECLAGIPLHRYCKPEEVASTMIFLASDYASMITGAIVPVDGGKVTL